MKEVANEEECLQQFFEGEVNRTICEHKLNKQSSRSHCVFTLHVESRSRVESSEKIIVSKLNLVDLAGSERTKKTGSEGKVFYSIYLWIVFIGGIVYQPFFIVFGTGSGCIIREE